MNQKESIKHPSCNSNSLKKQKQKQTSQLSHHWMHMLEPAEKGTRMTLNLGRANWNCNWILRALSTDHDRQARGPSRSFPFCSIRDPLKRMISSAFLESVLRLISLGSQLKGRYLMDLSLSCRKLLVSSGLSSLTSWDQLSMLSPLLPGGLENSSRALPSFETSASGTSLASRVSL